MPWQNKITLAQLQSKGKYGENMETVKIDAIKAYV